MNCSIRILLVDDHALVRTALAERLERERSFTVAGCVGDAEGAVNESRACNPDIVLMDIDMPGLNCFEAARRISSIRPECRIIFVSAFFHDIYIEQALSVKARGYITKTESPEIVVDAIREAMSGGVYFSKAVRERITVDVHGPTFPTALKTRLSTLTPRELEMLRYIARGMSKTEIAQAIGIAVKTVDRHCTNLMRKLDIHDRVDLARFAIREGVAET